MAVAFGKKQKEESSNDKMVRLFKEGKSVHEISMELEFKEDVITNVIRRRCGEDSIPETVKRSKNAVPHAEDVPLKADIASAAEAMAAEQPDESAEAEEETPAYEGMSKLERMMLEKEKLRKEKEAAAQVAEPEEPAAEDVSMEGISTDGLEIDSIGSAEPAVVSEPEPAAQEAEMEGISAADIPDLSEKTQISGNTVSSISDSSDNSGSSVDSYSSDSSFSSGVSDESAAETVPEKPAAEETSVHEEPAVSFEMPAGAGGSAFDKMKAFASAQIEANNSRVAQLEKKLSEVEGDYTARLAEAEKTLENAKVTYEDAINKSDELSEKRAALQAEHRTELAKAEEDYRKKLAALDEEYNNATAHANKLHSEKEDALNSESDAVNAEKEKAKNSFLESQSALDDIKAKISSDVEAVKAEIAALKEENSGYEKFF